MKFAYGLILMCWLSTQAFANTINKREETMMQMNRYSVIENAYSHGSMGFDLGIGGHFFNMNDPQALSSSTYPDRSSKIGFIPKLFVVKGLDAPIDLGMSIGQYRGSTDDTPSMQYGAHIQWAIIQEEKLPALAARGSYNRLQMTIGDMATSEISVIAGKGFLGYINAYAGLTVSHSTAEFKHIPEHSDFSLADPDDMRVTMTSNDLGYLIGLGVLAYPPFLSIDLETQRSVNRGGQTFTTKFSVGL